MKNYQVNRINQHTRQLENTTIQRGKNRLDAWARLEGFTPDELNNVNVKKDGRWLIVTAPDYSAAIWQIVITARG